MFLGEKSKVDVDIISTNSFDLIIVDLMIALVSEAELNGEMKDQMIGAQSRLMSKSLRKTSTVGTGSDISGHNIKIN